MKKIFIAFCCIFALTCCHNAGSDSKTGAITIAQHFFEKGDFKAASATLDSAVINHRADYGAEDLCRMAQIYYNISQASSSSSDPCLLKAATVFSYAQKLDPDAAKSTMEKLQPRSVHRFMTILLVSAGDDVFEDSKQFVDNHTVSSDSAATGKLQEARKNL